MAEESTSGSGEEGGERRKGDYGIGYGKPPRHTQFKKGQSGNPRGPKKGSRGLRKDLHKALNTKLAIKVSGKVVRGTTQELALCTLATRAASGDVRAIKQLTDLVLQLFGPEDRGRERQALSNLDQELLDRLLEQAEPDETEEAEQESSEAAPAPDTGPEAEGPEAENTDDKESDDEA